MKLFSLLLILPFLLGIFSCGSSERVEPKSKTNSPPVIRSVTILLENPTRENDLGVTVQGHDPDKDPITYSYQWMKNGEEIVGENKSNLKGGNFEKGDLIQVRVTPSDGKAEGRPMLSDAVKILNSPPVIQEVRIEPKVAKVGDNLKAHIKSFDADRDFIYFIYQWEKNGVVLSEERGEVLTGNQFKKGDSITVTVTPDDREVMGRKKKSEPIVVINSPPYIISSPPPSAEGRKYFYQVKTFDPDDDPITNAITSGPKEMTIDKKTGLVQWEIKTGEKGTYPVEIEVYDKEGANCKQRFTLSVEISPQR